MQYYQHDNNIDKLLNIRKRKFVDTNNTTTYDDKNDNNYDNKNSYNPSNKRLKLDNTNTINNY